MPEDAKVDAGNEYGEDYMPGASWKPKPYGAPHVSCAWDAWGSWARSVTCGSGTSSRYRVCKCSDGSQNDGEKCGEGKSSETKWVNAVPCYTCTLGLWSSFSSSTATCGTWTSYRTRSCDCTDGISRPNGCGHAGALKEFKEHDEGPCGYTTPQWKPKPYRKRRHRRS